MNTFAIPVHYENKKVIPLKSLPDNINCDGFLILLEEDSYKKKSDWSGLFKLKHLDFGGIDKIFERKEFYE